MTRDLSVSFKCIFYIIAKCSNCQSAGCRCKTLASAKQILLTRGCKNEENSLWTGLHSLPPDNMQSVSSHSAPKVPHHQLLSAVDLPHTVPLQRCGATSVAYSASLILSRTLSTPDFARAIRHEAVWIFQPGQLYARASSGWAKCPRWQSKAIFSVCVFGVLLMVPRMIYRAYRQRAGMRSAVTTKLHCKRARESGSHCERTHCLTPHLSQISELISGICSPPNSN